jgi:regulator of sigma E protease
MNPDLNSLLLNTPNAVLAIGVVLGLAILFHEGGHFLAARLCGIGVEEFAVGFGPPLFRRRFGETVYSLRLLPLGGFARIAGMEGPSYDLPGGLFTKPRWMQTLVFMAGAAMNLVLAALLFTVVVFSRGVPDPKTKAVVVDRTLPNRPAAQAGLRPGDYVLAVDGHRDSLRLEEVLPGGLAARAGLRRAMSIAYANGRRVAVPGELASVIARGGPRLQLIVVNPEAEKVREIFQPVTLQLPAHLRRLVAQAAGRPVRAAHTLAIALGVQWAPLSTSAMADYVAQRPGIPVVLSLERQGKLFSLTVVPRPVWERVPEPGPGGSVRTPHRQVGRIGVVLTTPRRTPGLLEGVKLAMVSTAQSVVMMVSALKAMLLREIAPDIGGPLAIMAMTAEQSMLGWLAVLEWAGLISANLAIINLLPLPPLDGFHLVMVGWEAVTRRRVNERVRTGIIAAGFVFIAMLFAVLTYRDLWNLIHFRTP